jgi:hypothetical protein
MSLWSGAENAASQTANDVDTAPVISLATVPGVDESIKIKVGEEESDNGPRIAPVTIRGEMASRSATGVRELCKREAQAN